MNKYQEALNEIKEMHCNIENCDCEKCNMTPFCAYYECCKTLQELVDKANKYDEKETPMKPPLTWEYAEPKTRCKCSAGVEKYHSYCWNCGQKLDWSDE
jgi:hypothetical protein